MSDTQEREAFEALIVKRYGERAAPALLQKSAGHYAHSDIQHDWSVWQAARATPPQVELSALPELPPLPKPDLHCYDADSQSDVWSHSETNLRAYGLLCRQSAPWNPTDKELVQMQEDARDAMLWRQSGDAADKRDAALVEAAMKWWESHRPNGWSVREHIESYEVNCVPGSEELARLVAAIAQRQEGGE